MQSAQGQATSLQAQRTELRTTNGTLADAARERDALASQLQRAHTASADLSERLAAAERSGADAGARLQAALEERSALAEEVAAERRRVRELLAAAADVKDMAQRSKQELQARCGSTTTTSRLIRFPA